MADGITTTIAPDTTIPAPDYGDDFVPSDGDAVNPEPRVDNPDLAAPKKDEVVPDPKTEVVPDPKATVTPDPKVVQDPKATVTPDPAGEDKGHMIPKSRFDTKNKLLRLQEDENRRLKLEVAALKAAGEKPGPKADVAPVLDLDAQLDAIDEKILAARKDGDLAAERSAMTESRKLMREHHAAEVAEASSSASNAAVETMMLDGVIDDLEAAYPFLNPKDAGFDKGKADDLVELWEAFELKGYRKTSALLKATSILFPDADEAALVADLALKTEPKVEPKVEPKKTDLKKNIDTALKTPPNLEGEGGLPSDHAGLKDDIKPSRLSEKDLEALPESVKARLRGDVI